LWAIQLNCTASLVTSFTSNMPPRALCPAMLAGTTWWHVVILRNDFISTPLLCVLLTAQLEHCQFVLWLCPALVICRVVCRFANEWEINLNAELCMLTTCTHSRPLGVCRKLKIGSDSVFKKLTCPKIWHPFRWFSDRNHVLSAVQIKSEKKTLLSFNMQLKNILKHYRNSLAYRWHTMQLLRWDLLTTVSEYAQFILHSSNAVIFAVN